MDAIALLLLQIVVILVTSRLVGFLFRLLHQPQVMGEMIAGILLGPSLLGWVSPKISAMLFPVESLNSLNAISQLGLILFMFLVGLELDVKSIRKNGARALLISHTSILFPFFLGGLLALVLYPQLSNNSVSFSHFTIFIGTAMSITAFPVLARILSERNLINTPLGSISLACAAIDDVSGWILLAVVVILARSASMGANILLTVFGLLLFVLLTFLVFRPIFKRLSANFEKSGKISHDLLAILFLFLLISAWVTEELGVHALFGAFIIGAAMPKENEFVHRLTEKVNDLAVVLFLPIFFALTGLNTRINLIDSPQLWIFSLLIILVAIMGKFGGASIAARVSGLPWRESGAVGILMNTRGLMELVLLNIGLEIGVISSAIFSMFILMTITTTFMTAPLLEWIYFTRLVPKQYGPVTVGAEMEEGNVVTALRLE
jgi:Kef-type K+ transport system membrane component KefB